MHFPGSKNPYCGFFSKSTILGFSRCVYLVHVLKQNFSDNDERCQQHLCFFGRLLFDQEEHGDGFFSLHFWSVLGNLSNMEPSITYYDYISGSLLLSLLNNAAVVGKGWYILKCIHHFVNKSWRWPPIIYVIKWVPSLKSSSRD